GEGRREGGGVERASLLDRNPSRRSGGEKQRVARGRSTTRARALCLTDEPFSNLDQALREKYRVNLKMLLKQFNITTVYVTHDHYEALILADLLAIMDRGRIEQVGTYQQIYDQPRNVFVAGFLNRHTGTPPINFVDARHIPDGESLDDVRVGVRPEDILVSAEASPGSIEGIIREKLDLPMNSGTIVVVRVGDPELHVHTNGIERLRAGDRVWLSFQRYHVFDRESGERLRSHPQTF